MTDRVRHRATLGAAALLAIALIIPADATAQGRHAGGGGHGRSRGGVVVVGGAYYAPWFGFGAGWGPWGFYGPWGYGAWGYYPPAYYMPEGGVPMGVAMMSGFGGVDLDVKPGRADVWVDGKYAGEARDFDGYPSYLWLKKGVHRLQVHKGGYELFDEEIDVQAGFKKSLRVRLEPGESQPPGPKPDGKRAEDKDEKPREKKY